MVTSDFEVNALTGKATQSEPSKISVRQLNLSYGRMHALKNVSVDIHDHAITALIGPSGCGKSSFLRCLNRMNDLIRTARVEGKVWVDGVDIYDRSIDVVELRKRVGMVFQKPNPFPMSVFDNVAYGPRIHGVNKRALPDLVERSLRAAALWDEVKDKLRQSAMDLSGGQQQRLCIARCLAVDPEVILLDEPCSALDPISTFRIEELLLQLKSRYAVVIVTHNLFQASRIADRTGFFLEGELIEMGATVDLFERPQDPRTDGFVRGRFG